MITLDGSYGEGGGQILRNAAVYAVLLGQELRITNIRAGRSSPGLRRQHMTGLTLVAEGSGRQVDGLSVGSTEIRVRLPSNHQASPSPLTTTSPRSGDDPTLRVVTGDTHTAGSICLLLQAALPVALLMDDGRRRGRPTPEASTRWIIRGGTNATNAPQYDYWQLVFLPMLLQLYHIPPECIRATLVCRGFFPKGGGEVHVDTVPLLVGRRSSLPAIHLTERGDVVHVLIRAIYAGKCPRRVAEGMARAAKDYLEQHLPTAATSTTAPTTTRDIHIQVEINYEEPAVASGSGIILVATTDRQCRLGGSAVGSPRKTPQEVGIEAAAELCATLLEGGCVDDYLQDQLILYMALAEGTSELITGSLTHHTRTAIWTAEQCCGDGGVQFHVTPLMIPLESTTPPPPPTTTTTSSTPYGTVGRIPGRHRIQCTGMGIRVGTTST